MTTIDLDLEQAPFRLLIARLVAPVGRWRKRRAQRLALAELMAYSPHFLADIGVTPEEIAAALAERREARRPNPDRPTP